jgi:hypothetical protein
MALAYQVVIQTSGPVRLTHEGRKQLHDLIKELRKYETEGRPPDEIAAAVEDVFHRMVTVMQTELEPVGGAAGAAAAPGSTTTTTSTVRDSASTTSTTETVRSSTTTTTARPTTTTSSTTTSTTTTSTSAP